MALRSRPAVSYFLKCDRVGCHRTSLAGLAPFEAEALAERAGWSREWSRHPPLHYCPEHATTSREAPGEAPAGELFGGK